VDAALRRLTGNTGRSCSNKYLRRGKVVDPVDRRVVKDAILIPVGLAGPLLIIWLCIGRIHPLKGAWKRIPPAFASGPRSRL
jgi:hypothetical protein